MITKTPIEPLLAKPRCYGRNSQGAVFALSFIWPNDERILAPYSYLKFAKMRTPEELIFFYSFGDIRVKGNNLERICDLAQVLELTYISSRETDQGDDGVRVTEIIFEPDEAD